MGSTPDTDNGVEFDIIIDRGGRVSSAEYPREAEKRVKGLLGRLDARAPQSPRLLPHADEILTPEDVARHLSIPKKTVIFLCAEGRLEGAFKAGRRWRVPGRAVRKMAGVP